MSGSKQQDCGNELLNIAIGKLHAKGRALQLRVLVSAPLVCLAALSLAELVLGQKWQRQG